jgi:hypothetical protein
MQRLISADPMRQRARVWRVLRLLRDWPAAAPLPALPVLATLAGFGRAATPAEALARLRGVLDRLAREGRLRWSVHEWCGRQEWLVVMHAPARTLVSAGAPAHWSNVK